MYTAIHAARPARPDGDSMTVDPRLLEILNCPACRGEVGPSGSGLECGRCGRVYPVRDGIPIMLVDVGEQFRDTAEEDLPVPPPEV